MASVINASTNGLVTTGDNTGTLNIQVSGNNALTVAADKTVSFIGGGVVKNLQERLLPSLPRLLLEQLT